ncbi:MAG: sodium:proton antiporter [Caulobacteraceae bacterium]|nr:sodium:proton antiporter [Caulobacteraceae bacterium]
MQGFDLAAAFLVLIAAVGWINTRFLRLPVATAMVLAGLIGAGSLLLTRHVWPPAYAFAAAIVAVDFPRAVLGYMLAFLLFAGAMQVDVQAMRTRLLTIAGLATLGVVASMLIVGFGLWGLAGLLGLPLSLAWAMVFGALISPTDPIAVLAAVRQGSMSKTLQVVLQGEALFNDGVGIVIFAAAVTLAAGGQDLSAMRAVGEVLIEAFGGLVMGAVAAWITLRAIAAIDDGAVQVGLSLALCAGVYSLADLAHISGPIAVVSAGMVMGSGGLKTAMSEACRHHLETFWTLIDELLNAVLFLFLGLEVLVVPLDGRLAWLWLAAIVLVLLARLAVVAPWGAWLRLRRSEVGPTQLLAWGGLHGALSLALALSIPDSPARGLILSTTFAVVIFSVVIQGLTFAPLAARLARGPGTET